MAASKYSERYSIQDLRDMGESNRRHNLTEEMYNAFEDEVLHPKQKLEKPKDKEEVKVEKYGSNKWAKEDSNRGSKHVKHS